MFNRSNHARRKHLFFVSMIVLLAAGLLTGCSLGEAASAETEITPVPTVISDHVVSAEGHMVPRDSVWLSFEQIGRVAEVLVDEGQQVTEGTVLARLDGREGFDAAVRAAELELLSAQQELDNLNEKAEIARSTARQSLAEALRAAIEANQALDELDTRDYKDQIDDAWVAVQDAKDELEDAQETYDKYKDLDEDNPDRKDARDALDDAQSAYDEALREHDRLKNDLEQARAAAAQAEAAVEDAQRDYDARQDGPNPDELALAQSRLESAEAQLAAARAALDNLELVAPFDGTIVQVEIANGQPVNPNQLVLRLADFSEWYVETSDLTEMEVVRLEQDQPVTIIPDAVSDLSLSGQVERISDVYNERGGDILYLVRVRLNETDPRLRWGMTVEAQFSEK